MSCTRKRYTMKERDARGAIHCGEGLTEQSHKDSCDINVIMKNYDKTGMVPVMLDQVPKFGDFSQVVDYQSALNLVIDAEEKFMQLPAAIRNEYDHDPQKFLFAIEDPSQRARLIELGVIVDTIDPKVATKVGVDDKASGDA